MADRFRGVRPTIERPIHCANCGRRLAPRYETEWRQVEDGDGVRSEHWYTGKVYGQGIGNVFCTNGCAIRFGFRCVAAGVRFESWDPVVLERRRELRESGERKKKERRDG